MSEKTGGSLDHLKEDEYYKGIIHRNRIVRIERRYEERNDSESAEVWRGFWVRAHELNMDILKWWEKEGKI